MPSNLYLEKSIKKTNLFENHKHYKYIPLLWNQYLTENLKDSEVERFKRIQIVNKNFYEFCYLLIIRALHYLGFQSRTQQILKGSDFYNTKKLYTWVQSIKIIRDELPNLKIQLKLDEFSITFHPIFEKIHNCRSYNKKF